MTKELSNKKKLENALKIAIEVLKEYADQSNWTYDGEGNWGKYLNNAEDDAQYALEKIEKYVNINELMGNK